MVAITTSISPKSIPHSKLRPCPYTRKNPPCHRSKKTQIPGNSIAFDCTHPTVINGLCLLCNSSMDDDHGVPFSYLLEGLRFTLEGIARLKDSNSEKVFGQKKLHLVLDLDHTLLHTKDFNKLTPDELYLKTQTDSDTSNGSLFILDDNYLMKLRPFVRTFLEEASSMFELYICSMGNRYYVNKVAKFLDPQDKYFDTRLIAREDFMQKGKKNLNLVIGQERGIVILDDTKSVWSEHLDNLITVEQYNYFTVHNGDDKSHAEMKTDENETAGELVNVLRILRRIHEVFFDSQTYVKDVRYLDL